MSMRYKSLADVPDSVKRLIPSAVAKELGSLGTSGNWRNLQSVPVKPMASSPSIVEKPTKQKRSATIHQLAPTDSRRGHVDLLPQEKLWFAVKDHFPDEQVEWEMGKVVPRRNYRIDIALPKRMLAIEVDGWSFHGKHLAGFKKDREKQNLLVVEGWRVLRFTAGEINKDAKALMPMIERALAK